MALACKHSTITDSCLHLADNVNSYNGTSDLQLERMNVYFNEVGVLCPIFNYHC
jgi:hypothetical protein